MNKKNFNKYTSFIDRFPFIIVAAILVFTVIFIFQLKTKFPLPFFSGYGAAAKDTASASYPILIASPASEQVFNFASKTDYVPIEIQSKAIQGLNYNLNLVINDNELIKTFSSPPFRHDWRPDKPGEYLIAANAMDDNNKIISSSNKIKFTVKFKYEEEAPETVAMYTDMTTYVEDTAGNSAPIIALKIYEGPTYSAGDDICYYRVKAIVTGNSVTEVLFSKDDSGGVWGPFNTQINLTRNTPNYMLTATAKNLEGQSMSSITLNWDLGSIEGNQ